MAVAHMRKGYPRIIGIVGGSCAGKTWLAERLAEGAGAGAVRVSLDSFYRDRSDLSAARRARLNFDHPRAIDWPCFEEALQSCAAGGRFSAPEYDFSTHARRAGGVAFPPARVVIVEGLWLFRRPSVRRFLDLKIFIRSEMALCVSRRLERDTRERGRTASQVLEQWQSHAQPMFSRFVAPQERWADVILEAPVQRRDVAALLERIMPR